MEYSSYNVNTPQWREITVGSHLPAELRKLAEIAHNLWWKWNDDAKKLYCDLDSELWKEVEQNPVLFLERINYEKLVALAHDENFVYDQTVEVDIPQYADMKASTARKLKRMLVILSGLAPYKPSVENLATEIGVSKNNVPDYLVYLERAGMIGLLRDDTSGMRNLGKVEKVYVDNPSLMSVLTSNPNIGNIRETFFYNQMREKQDVTSSRVSDFTIGDYTFEIGGRKKGKKQIEDVKNGRIVKDDIETGHGIIIPLWYFGMNY